MESIDWRPRLWEDGTAGITDPFELLAYFQIINRIYLLGGPIALDIRTLSALCRQTEKRFLNSLAALIDKGKVFIEDDQESAENRREVGANAARTKILRHLKNARISARHCGGELERATKRMSDARERKTRYVEKQRVGRVQNAFADRRRTGEVKHRTNRKERVPEREPNAQQTQTLITPLTPLATSPCASTAPALADPKGPAGADRCDSEQPVASPEQIAQLRRELDAAAQKPPAKRRAPSPPIAISRPPPPTSEISAEALAEKIRRKREELAG